MPLQSVRHILIVIAILIPAMIAGCSDNVQLPSSEELRHFHALEVAQPNPKIDPGMIYQGHAEAYRVVPNEVLEVRISSFLEPQIDTPASNLNTTIPITCRINRKGMITLPVIGTLPVAGLTLSQIEATVIQAYYPTYAKVYPSVFVKLLEPKYHQVSINGAVKIPGVYSLTNDQMNLLSILKEAGGIIESGATSIHIDRPNPTRHQGDQGPQAHSSGRISTTQLISPPQPHWNLSFQQDLTRTTTGWLSVSQGNQPYLRQGLDVASEPDRWALVQQLASRHPEVDRQILEQQLSQLATSLSVSGQARLSCASLCSAVHSPLSNALASSLDQTTPPSSPESTRSTSIVLPVKGIHAPFANITLQAGDQITVERMVVPIFTVIGLVNHPGNYPYPPGTHYNLIQALGFSGGLNLTLDPRYAMIYRQDTNGQIVHAAFQLNDPHEQGSLAYAANIAIQPGDIIAIEQTPRTRTKEFINKFFNVNVGAYVPLIR